MNKEDHESAMETLEEIGRICELASSITTEQMRRVAVELTEWQEGVERTGTIRDVMQVASLIFHPFALFRFTALRLGEDLKQIMEKEEQSDESAHTK